MEVVSQVSSAHKERTDIRLIKDALTDVITSMDSDDDGTITRSECAAGGSGEVVILPRCVFAASRL